MTLTTVAEGATRRTANSGAQEIAQFDRIAGVARQVCKSAELFGSTRTVDGTLSGGISLSKVLKALSDASVAASLRAGYSDWRGVRQQDAAAALNAGNACAERMFKLMLERLYLSDVSTGTPIGRPTDISKTYHLVSESRGAGADRQENIANGSIQTVISGNGNTVVLNEQPKDALRRSDLEAVTRLPPSLRVTNIAIFLPDEKDDLRFNVHYLNQGQASVRGIVPHFGVGLGTGVLDAATVDKLFENFVPFTQPDPNSGDLIQVGEDRFSTFPDQLSIKSGITVSKFKETQDKKGTLYLIVEVRFLDTRDNSKWSSQLCEYYDFNVPQDYIPKIAPHMCPNHNGVFRADEALSSPH